MACKGFDGQVVRLDNRVKDLMSRFVRVRIVKGNSMDLATFQFDYDLTFAAFFMNADRTIYGRYGTRSSARDAMRNISLEGFRAALAAALELHKNYPANRASLAGKTGPAPRFPVPERYPSLTRYKPALDYAGKVARSCMHCHMIRAAERKVYRVAAKPIPDHELYPWPLPEAVGITLDPKEKAKITSVAAGSAAGRAGFRKGDEIVTFKGQPVISIADMQWVLHQTRGAGRLAAEVLRGGRRVKLTLTLAPDWRRKSDISWRTSTWDLRRMGTGGLLLEALPDADRRKAGLAADALALRVKHAGRYGEHGASLRAGFRKGDIIVALDGITSRMTETDLLAHTLQKKQRGEKVPATVLRGGRRIDLKIPMQ